MFECRKLSSPLIAEVLEIVCAYGMVRELRTFGICIVVKCF